ncbi:bifunctional protein-disulfide isomerase/oxidoreductase DsbC [Colwellia sp. Arc7-635]|uniref:bifunctional protein-disulfide isomerase/oxidoreductase DsbC n=1 Tax=Colwellia sp. Arc7-635 TaxID=2497879 RepID=UPI000F8584C6|nr:bifunctional protein-disulfide isomerase/oxidoreductase DsbC [Colwellia sp. Arc7-635]AZQ85197.1 bifunctional protein-disulfide isomerase/oxidoreductase DsbC [Colwellia sp. Arc7-635]
MSRKFLLAAALGVLSLTNHVGAYAEPITPANNSVMLPAVQSPELVAVKAKLTKSLGFNIASIKPSPMDGVVEVITDQGLFYASADGNFLLHGKMYGVGESVSNLTEESLAQVRVEGMEKFSESMIVFPAKNEKHVVTVFTDITCGYCRKMHEQMADYNDKGITIRYLAYPRAGVKDRSGQYSQGFKDLRSIWCHENPQQALTKAKTGSSVAARICDKPIEDEFNFGRQVGVTGTPAIMLANGMMVPGYQEPSKLFMLLETAQQGG